MITFYDLAAQPSISTWSPNPWKVRYVLNFKNLSYKTIRMEFPDIADISKSVGIPPCGTQPDGVTPLYTSPAITDDTTGAAITDSYKIVEYLEKQIAVMITFYDLAAQPSISTWSPNPWKVRYVLNFKNLSYKTIRMEFPDIADISKSVGIPPCGTQPDGVTPLYTSPAITDDTTGAAITDSYKIVEYLEKQSLS